MWCKVLKCVDRVDLRILFRRLRSFSEVRNFHILGFFWSWDFFRSRDFFRSWDFSRPWDYFSFLVFSDLGIFQISGFFQILGFFRSWVFYMGIFYMGIFYMGICLYGDYLKFWYFYPRDQEFIQIRNLNPGFRIFHRFPGIFISGRCSVIFFRDRDLFLLVQNIFIFS